ncbi:restriction endonuclease [Xylella fastidiosa subsp. multiplex]|uniref:Restriction endonuclease n=1 Tax=Xylella fastidiosa subsp. multiplex TaxID=644357 RepID=A0AAW6HRV3_XYLFS|nr:ABC-three component system protein [Xylella fastidiosa]MDC6407350.1 restriction endonuclease [Xylella fastidiosa subsp. multiplex]MDD0936770.1 restriction endonuclease [Xylella fastidiosa subsp. multiplex]MSS67790.1 restriction endonuclease [Xylella fastidiosa subsp. multiplex]
MKFAYEDLSESQFEVLIALLCQRLLGISVQSFSKGPDGGRDAKFIGTAQLHPSEAAPWRGTVIIQAKHSNGIGRKFSEHDFHHKSRKKTVINEEIPRIKKLRDTKELDHYMLFSNRKLSAGAETEISNYISNQCGIPKASIYLCGVEQLEILLKRFPEVAKEAKLDPVDSPLIFNSDDLAEIIEALAVRKDALIELLEQPPTVRVSYEKKNALNNMTAEYAKEQRKRYLKETRQIGTFLAMPENIELLHKYQSVVEDLGLKIIAYRKDHQTFDKLMEYMVDIIFKRDPVLRQHTHKGLTRAVLFYMYWNCDIGETGDATPDETFAS